MVHSLRRHIEQRFNSASLVHLPFPHLIIEDFFPPDVYQTILDANPFPRNRGTEWISAAVAPTKTVTPYWARKQINFHRNEIFQAAPAQQGFWEAIKQCFLADDWFAKLIVAAYPDYFLLRFGEIAATSEFSGLLNKELFLQRHEPGFYIGPHTDIPTRIATCIFAFADRPGFEEYGTQLCVHRNPLVRCWGNDHHKPDDFVIRKVAPYRPNNFLLFFKTRQSFHAVKAIDSAVPNQRYGMQFQLYEPPRGLFVDLSEPDLMVTKLNK